MKKTIILMTIFFATVLIIGCENEESDNGQNIDEEEMFCAEYYNPVCGIDGITYSNECFAEIANVEIAYEGECEIEQEKIYCTEEQKQAEFCTREYMPVCGSDGNTYSNKCVACSKGIEYYLMGEC